MIRALALVLLLAATADAKCVVIVGDSISAKEATLYPATPEYPTGSEWPAILRAIRPDITTCNISVPGRNTVQALAQFDNTMAWIKLTHEVDTVVFLIGVNNITIPRSPLQTATDIRALAQKARNWGADEVILTLTPANPTGTQSYTNEVNNWLYHLNGSSGGYTVAGLRDVFTIAAWPPCAGDTLHPAGAAGLPCREAIADFVASWVPGQ